MSWLSRWFARREGTLANESRRRRLSFERLEDRRVLSVQFIPNLSAGTFPPTPREAIHFDVFPSVHNSYSNETFHIALDPRPDSSLLAVGSLSAMRVSSTLGASGPASKSATPTSPSFMAFDDYLTTTFDASGRLFAAFTGFHRFDQGQAYIQRTTVQQLDPLTGDMIGSPINVHPYTMENWLDTAPYITAAGDTLYVTWLRRRYPDGYHEVYSARSTDQGATWTSTLVANSLGANPTDPADDFGNILFPVIAADTQGNVYVSFHAQRNTTPGYLNQNMVQPDGVSGRQWLWKSTDSGATFNLLDAASQPFPAGEADISFNRREIEYVATSIAGASYWTRGSVRAGMVVDPARPGHVYMVVADDPDNVHGSGDDSDLKLACSTDGGATWTVQTIASGPNQSFQLFPQMAIDQTGTVVLAWYDNRDSISAPGTPISGRVGGEGSHLVDVYAKYSVDGGATWTNDFRVNVLSQSYNADEPYTRRFSSSTSYIGDGFGLAVRNETAYVAYHGWTPSMNTASEARFVTFPINGTIQVQGTAGVNDEWYAKPVPNSPAAHVALSRRAGGVTTTHYVGNLANTQIELQGNAGDSDFIGVGERLTGGGGLIPAREQATFSPDSSTVNLLILPDASAGINFSLKARGFKTYKFYGNLTDVAVLLNSTQTSTLTVLNDASGYDNQYVSVARNNGTGTYAAHGTGTNVVQSALGGDGDVAVLSASTVAGTSTVFSGQMPGPQNHVSTLNYGNKTVTLSNFNKIYVYGLNNAADTAAWTDSPGNDLAYMTSGYTTMTNASGTFLLQATNFRAPLITANAGGTDYLTIYDGQTTADELVVNFETKLARMKYAGSETQAPQGVGFEYVGAYFDFGAAVGADPGFDKITWWESSQNDIFFADWVGGATRAFIQGVFGGIEYSYQAYDYNDSVAYFGVYSNDVDVVYLLDAPGDDRLTAATTLAQIEYAYVPGPGTWNSRAIAYGMISVYTARPFGGNDTKSIASGLPYFLINGFSGLAPW